MPNFEYRSYGIHDLELRSDGRTVVGIAAPFNSPTTIHESHGVAVEEVIRPGAFRRTLAERGPERVKLLAQHDMNRLPLGRLTAAREVTDGLWIEGRISQTEAGDEALELVRDGVLDSFSIGFRPTRDGMRYPSPLQRELTDLRLFEVSLVPFPAYEKALVMGVRSESPDQHPNDTDLLRRRLALISQRKTS